MLRWLDECIHRCFSAGLAIQRPFARMVRVQRSIDDPIGSLLAIESEREVKCPRFGRRVRCFLQFNFDHSFLVACLDVFTDVPSSTDHTWMTGKAKADSADNG